MYLTKLSSHTPSSPDLAVPVMYKNQIHVQLITLSELIFILPNNVGGSL